MPVCGTTEGQMASLIGAEWRRLFFIFYYFFFCGRTASICTPHHALLMFKTLLSSVTSILSTKVSMPRHLAMLTCIFNSYLGQYNIFFRQIKNEKQNIFSQFTFKERNDMIVFSSLESRNMQVSHVHLMATACI